MTLGTLFVAWGLYKMNRIGWWAIIVHSTLVIIHNTLTIINMPDKFMNVQGAIFQIITISIVLYLIVIREEFRIIFFNPRLRWWESKPRYLFPVDAILETSDGKKNNLKIEDISFYGIRTLPVKGDTVKMDDKAVISFEYDAIPVKGDVKVLRLVDSKIAMKFLFDSKQEIQSIKKIIRMLKQQNARKEGSKYWSFADGTRGGGPLTPFPKKKACENTQAFFYNKNMA